MSAPRTGYILYSFLLLNDDVSGDVVGRLMRPDDIRSRRLQIGLD